MAARGSSRPVPVHTGRAAALVVVAFVALVIALWAARAGAYPLGTAYEDNSSCLIQGALPADVKVAREGPVPVEAKRTWFPLGVICTVHPLGRDQTALVIPHQSWPATWTSLAGFAVAAFALLTAAATTIRTVRSRIRGRAS